MKTEQPVSWECAHCGKEFKYESEKRRHEQSHVPQFECKDCSKKFSFLSALRRHEKQHERKGSVQCDKCGGKFRDEALLRRHTQYAHKGSFSCSQCYTTFNSEQALKTHAKTHKAESERKYHCGFDGCNKSFNFPHHLKHHELTHTDTKQFFCKKCGKGFIQSYHWKVHRLIHDPDSWLPCTEPNCSKKFVNEYARKRHLATHRNKPTSLRTKLKSPPTTPDEDEILHCTVCDVFYSSINSAEHQAICIPKDRKPDFSIRSLQISINEISDNINKAQAIAVGDKDLNDDAPIPDINEVNENITICKDVIGECISDDSCYCAQIDPSVDEFQDMLDKNNKIKVQNELSDFSNNNIVKIAVDFKTRVNESIEKDLKLCRNCLSENCFSNKNCLGYTVQHHEIPAIEYKIDGTIRIKDTCDLYEVPSVKLEEQSAIVNFENDANTVEFSYITNVEDVKVAPFINSCRDVLGDCIVSGNSTIEDGCLCAKMATDSRPMIAQEIEDITPCPKNTWLSQRL